MRLVTALVMAGLLAGAGEAAAQADESRFFLSVSGAFEPGSQTFADEITFSRYDETARVRVASDDVSSGAVLDFGVGVRVTGNWTLAANFHRTSSVGEWTVSGEEPHPIFFNRPRTFAATVGDLKRSEQALHMSVGYRVPLGEKLDVHIYAGPSQFRFGQEVVGRAIISEVGGTFSSVNVTYEQDRRKKNAYGGHVGADLSYSIFQTGATTFRLGGYVRYAGAKSEFPVLTASNSTVSTDLGGVQIGAGLRVRF